MRVLLAAVFAAVILLGTAGAASSNGAQEKRYSLPLSTEEWLAVVKARKAFKDKYGYYPRRGRSLSVNEVSMIMMFRNQGGARGSATGFSTDPEEPPIKLPDGVGAVPGICLFKEGPVTPPVEPPVEPPIDPCEECNSVQPIQ